VEAAQLQNLFLFVQDYIGWTGFKSPGKALPRGFKPDKAYAV